MQGIDLQRKGKELAAELDYYVKSHFEQLVEQFVDCFSEYCNKIYEMQRQGRKGAIAYIHFSVLQTNILLKKHESVWMRMMRIGFWITWNVVTVIMWENFILI
mgnify:CR=1 FL=1